MKFNEFNLFSWIQVFRSFYVKVCMFHVNTCMTLGNKFQCELYLNATNFHPREWIWKCCLQISLHFVPASMCYFALVCWADSRFAPSQWETSFKGLRPVLKGFVVKMHEGTCETGSQIPRALARGIWHTVRRSPSASWQQTPTDRS